MFLPSTQPSDLGRRKVHGLCSLPPGYALRPVALDADVVLDEEHSHFEVWTEENTEVFSRLRFLTGGVSL